MKKNKWKLCFFIGLIPYIILLLYAIYSFFFGIDVFTVKLYKIEAIKSVMFFYPIMYWFIFLPAIILIIISIIKIKKR